MVKHLKNCARNCPGCKEDNIIREERRWGAGFSLLLFPLVMGIIVVFGLYEWIRVVINPNYKNKVPFVSANGN